MQSFIVGAALLLAGGLGRADVEARIAQCAERATDAARIACLEDRLRELAGAGGAHGDAAVAEAPPPLAKPPEPAGNPVRDEPKPAAGTASPEPMPSAAGGGGLPATADPETIPEATELPLPDRAPRAEAAPVPSRETGASPGPAEVELGAEQVAARSGDEPEAAIVSARVVDFRFVGYRRLLVQLDNGQVWRQIDGDRVSVERGLRTEDSFEVEMWGTKLGGYRMHILPLDRTIRVERLR